MSVPYWLGTPPATAVNNEVRTTTTISSITYYNTPVNVVPQVLLATRSTTTLNTNNPSEILTYVVPASGWFQTHFVGVGSHVGGGATWSNANFTQLDWYVTRNNGVLSNTALICDPRFIGGDSVSEFISLTGTGVFPANQGDVLQWVTDGNAIPAVTSNYFSGFGSITLQKIG